ncbi:MAG: HTH domain-containing protein [Halovenus sp.]
MATTTDGERRIEFYVRHELPAPARDQSAAVYDRLCRLADRGVVSGIERHEWVGRVPLADCDRWLRDTYLGFTDWAGEAGVALRPFFSTRECYTPECEAYTDWLVLPALCLALYEGGQLQAVYPHADGDETVTVAEAVDSLERDTLEIPGTSPTPAD